MYHTRAILAQQFFKAMDPLGDNCRFAVLSYPSGHLYLCITKDRHAMVEKKGPERVQLVTYNG